ncbi:hypothetical protein [Neptuniibacter sp. QD37_11]|uniref:hypothetical protein n=1 Tax=Neptuniibacter sp. QD37_11 TaxID=3398209 RepID=UPI0039F581A0
MEEFQKGGISSDLMQRIENDILYKTFSIMHELGRNMTSGVLEMDTACLLENGSKEKEQIIQKCLTGFISDTESQGQVKEEQNNGIQFEL